MCDVVEQAYGMALSRRWFLGRSALLAGGVVGGLACGVAAGPATAAPPSARSRHGDSTARRYHTRPALLGTGAGPVWWLGSERAGVSSAVAVGDSVYLVDGGDGFGMRLRQTGLAPEPHLRAFDRLRAVFLTHLHSDHTIDYPNLLVFGTSYLGTVPEPIKVFGPGDRGELPDYLGGGAEPR